VSIASLMNRTGLESIFVSSSSVSRNSLSWTNHSDHDYPEVRVVVTSIRTSIRTWMKTYIGAVRVLLRTVEVMTTNSQSVASVS
jgi:hypothetical protein